MADDKMIIDTKPVEVQRLIEIGPDQEWTPFYDKINQLMLEEKKCRQDNDSILGAEICVKIVSKLFQRSPLDFLVISKSHLIAYDFIFIAASRI